MRLPMPDPARRTFPAAPESVGRVRGFVDRTLTLWGWMEGPTMSVCASPSWPPMLSLTARSPAMASL